MKKMIWTKVEFPIDDTSYDDNEKLIPGVLGLLNPKDPLGVIKQFNLYIGHCNFPITPQLGRAMESFPGVEIFHPFTPYRFLFAVGKIFDEEDVKRKFVKEFCQSEEINNMQDLVQSSIPMNSKKVYRLIDELSSKSFWCIYITKDGKVNHTSSDDDNYKTKIEIFKEAKAAHGGYILMSSKSGD